jgi:hypothetical protein
MPQSILFHHDSGSTCYALLFNDSAAAWNGSAFESYATANLGGYALSATELGTASGVFAVSVPSLPAGVYGAIACRRAGASPAESDPRVAVGVFSWDGSGIVPTPARAAITGGDYALATNAAGQVQVAPDPALADAVDDASPTASSFNGSSALSGSDDFYNGSVLAFTGGALRGLARRISDYAGSTRTITLAPALPAAPADDDPFLIVGRID